MKFETFPQISRSKLKVLQINVGKRCNQVCTHCHVSAGPERTEDMTSETATEILEFARKYHFEVADITGGAPEINAQFPRLLKELTTLCDKVIVRCNLTAALSRKKQTSELFMKYRPAVAASLPCYDAKNVDSQRGDGVFEKSIKALQWLNSMGFGREHELTLVYNPLKPTLPPAADELEKAYKVHLKESYDIDFTSLIAIANVPVGRYREDLESHGTYDTYIQLLKEHYNPSTVNGLMCRSHVNVDWQGRVFDCDFNNQLELQPFGQPRLLKDLKIEDWQKQKIAVADHCFTCTAGCGSSCGGSLT